jgi:hypothetical protein
VLRLQQIYYERAIESYKRRLEEFRKWKVNVPILKQTGCIVFPDLAEAALNSKLKGDEE